jgi:HK97 family phage portal protein
MPRTPQSIEKSSVTVSPPGLPVRFAILGGKKIGNIAGTAKGDLYGIYYEMFRQHPIVRGAIEKISKYAVATGFHFESDDKNEEIDRNREKAAKRFFRKSNAQHLLRITYKDILIYGESFWVVEKTMAGTPIRALRLHPKFMDPELTDADELVGWWYGPGVTEDRKHYKLDQILHFRLDDPDTDLIGLSLLHSLQLTVASDLNAMHFNGNFFENSAQTGLIIIVKTSTGDEAKRNREWLDQNYVGTRNAHRPLLLEGDVDVKASVNRMSDMQYVEGRVLNRQEIMTVLDVPPDKLNIIDDRRRDTEGSSGNFQAETISPLQTIVEEEINNQLFMTIFGWDNVMFFHNIADNRSELDQAKLYAEYERIGVMSVNQIADRLGLPRVEGGDGHFIQTAAGMIPIDLLDEVAKRLIQNGEALPDPISGVGTNTTGQRNPPKNTGAEESKLND